MTTTRWGGAVLAIGLLLTACGSASSNGEADKTADQILADAVAALKSAKSVHLQGSGTTGGSGPTSGSITVSADLASGGSARGEFSLAGAHLSLVSSGGKFYLKGRDFFSKVAGAQAATVIGDRWVILPANAATQGFEQFTDLSTLATCVGLQHGTLSKGGTASVAGQSAIILIDKGDKPGTQPGKFYVATTGTPYLLEVDMTGTAAPGTPPGSAQCGGASTGAGSFTISQFGASVSVTPPPNPLDLSTLSGG